MRSFNFSFFFLFFLTSINSFATEYCELFDTKTASKLIAESVNYTFKDRTLMCSSQTEFKSKYKNSQPIDSFRVVRSHLQELKGITILASNHGYHLINEKFSCTSGHCHHVDVIALKDFNALNSTKSKAKSLQKDIKIQAITDKINTNLWKSDVVTLSSWSRVSTTADNDSAQVWISDKMNNLGLQTSTQDFTISGNITRNIIGIHAGSIRPNDWYVVGAHMDSIPSSGPAPGALDNASGCAGVLEMARIASENSFEATLIFICYSGEEQGLFGSSAHVQSVIGEGNRDKIKAVLTMDMIGFTTNPNNHEVLIESSASSQFLIDILAQNAATYVPNLIVNTSTNPFGSDHVPYLRENMHAILSIDEDWDNYPSYHRSSDLPENLNLTQGEYILKTNMASLAQLATVIDTSEIVFVNGFEFNQINN